MDQDSNVIFEDAFEDATFKDNFNDVVFKDSFGDVVYDLYGLTKGGIGVMKIESTNIVG